MSENQFERYFNTVGAINPQKHYFLPHRLNWEELESFIAKEYYFVLHAPRQSGKTTAILEFVRHLNSQGKYKALYLSVESAHPIVDDVKEAIRALVEECKDQMIDTHPEETAVIAFMQDLLKEQVMSLSGFSSVLRFWSKNSSKPVVLFLDEFDGLVGTTLLTLLKQFRTGYTKRPENYPQTICLIGVRQLRDYQIKIKKHEDLQVLYSPFNIKAESLRLEDFSLQEVRTLYLQHTQETGQTFTEQAMCYAFEQTKGQPWLVNALAYQACFRDVKDRSQAITLEVLTSAREALIRRCDTHLDALVDRLKEPKVRTIVDALLSGGGEDLDCSPDDLQYVRDLGLITRNTMAIANPIYQEIIPRALSYTKQSTINQETSWYQNPDGTLNMQKLLMAFTQFYRENAKAWLERFDYKEAGPHLLLLAFLQRIINGGGTIHREYALGRQRVDLLIVWKTQRFVIELKIYKNKQTLPQGLAQVVAYMKEVGATEGHLVLFDRSEKKSQEKKIYQKQVTAFGKRISVWGL